MNKDDYIKIIFEEDDENLIEIDESSSSEAKKYEGDNDYVSTATPSTERVLPERVLPERVLPERVLPECSICFNTFSGRNQPVYCPFCSDADYRVCKECIKEYLLNSSNPNPHCMNCKKDWSNKYIYTRLGTVFVEKLYRNHLKDLYLEREKSKIPETMIIIQQENEKNKLVAELEAEYTRLTIQLDDLARNIQEIKNSKSTKRQSNTVFIQKCPVDNCMGMIESINYKCVMCKVGICKKCRSPMSSPSQLPQLPQLPHTCDVNDIETTKLLNKDTKACPKCATPIFKIAGCDQIWCTQCQIAFSWNTGEIETGTIHNPHYYEYLRETGQNVRNINDIPCGGLVDARYIQYSDYSQSKKNKILERHRITAECDYKIRQNQPETRFDGYRRKYVERSMTEGQLRDSIFRRERENARRNAKQQIYVTFRTIMIERLRELMTPPHTSAKYNTFIIETDKLRKYINTCLAEELKYLGSASIHGISGGWTWDKIPTKS